MVILVRADLSLLDAAVAGDDALAAALGHDVVAGWATFAGALRSTRDALAADPQLAGWGTRFFVAGDPLVLVGWGGFKGPPKQGVVELGYEIAESHWGRGLATEAVQAMLAEAFADESVTAVIAHTLAQPNASNRVLEKSGFRYDAEVADGSNVVWRFVLPRNSPDAPPYIWARIVSRADLGREISDSREQLRPDPGGDARRGVSSPIAHGGTAPKRRGRLR